MKIALMQPYFFPYLGYFQLIHSVDEFVIFDQTQYIRRSWITRNRILNAHKESIYINVPVYKAPRETKIKDIHINHENNWQEKIIQQLQYYKNAPNFNEVLEFVRECLNIKIECISQFNTMIIKKTCNLFNINTNITVLSEKLPSIKKANEADEWGIITTKALHGTTYNNAIGGKEFYDPQKYIDNGLDIQFIQPTLKPYNQFNQKFISGLSIIDIMMFNDVDTINKMMENYKLIR